MMSIEYYRFWSFFPKKVSQTLHCLTSGKKYTPYFQEQREYEDYPETYFPLSKTSAHCPTSLKIPRILTASAKEIASKRKQRDKNSSLKQEKTQTYLNKSRQHQSGPLIQQSSHQVLYTPLNLQSSWPT